MKKHNGIFAFLLTTVIILSAFSGCGKNAADEADCTSASESAMESSSVIDVTFTEEGGETLPDTSFEKKEPESTVRETEARRTEVQTTVPETAAPSESSTKYERTGESVFTDDPTNKYISSVVSKYNVDPSLLAAVYTIPDADGNIVMEFDGSKDENGKLQRNADTLVAIYTVDKNLNSKRASNDKSKNEYSTIESKTMFFSVTKYIIPKFESELNNSAL